MSNKIFEIYPHDFNIDKLKNFWESVGSKVKIMDFKVSWSKVAKLNKET